MSDPITMAALFTSMKTAFAAVGPALSAISTGTTFLAAKGQANAQGEMIKQANDSARKYMIEDYDQVTKMSQQENAGATQRQFENAKNAAKARATAKVSASAGGTTGMSVDALLNDLYGQEATIRDSINQNLENTQDQIGKERTGIGRNYANQVTTRQQPNQPSLIGAGLDLGSGLYDQYKDNLKIKAAVNKPR